MEIMKVFDAALIAGTVRVVEDYRVAGLMWFMPRMMTKDYRPQAEEMLAKTEKHCVQLELNASVSSIQKMRRLIAGKRSDNKRLGELATELSNRLFDEMSQKLYFSLTAGESDHYLNFRSGWQQVIDRFPDTLEDIEEARKCFAFSRYAGSVFHSLQVVEAGLIKLGTLISLNDPHSGRTAVCGQLKKVVEKKYTDRTDFEKQNYQFLEQTQATAEALKNAWRNKVSHAQGKLALIAKDFSPEIAEEILMATRSFMRRLADGLPTAKVQTVP